MKLSPAAAFFAPVLLSGFLAAGCAESLGDGLAGDLPEGGIGDAVADTGKQDSTSADTAKPDTGKVDTGSSVSEAGDDTEFPDFDSGTDDAGTVDDAGDDGGSSGGQCMVDTDCPGADACCSNGTCATKLFGLICLAF